MVVLGPMETSQTESGLSSQVFLQRDPGLGQTLGAPLPGVCYVLVGPWSPEWKVNVSPES